MAAAELKVRRLIHRGRSSYLCESLRSHLSGKVRGLGNTGKNEICSQIWSLSRVRHSRADLAAPGRRYGLSAWRCASAHRGNRVGSKPCSRATPAMSAS